MEYLYSPDRLKHPLKRAGERGDGKWGISEGDWVSIETKRGSIKQKAALTDTIDPRVVGVDYGWWFPERGTSSLQGWAESNINVLTNDKPPYNREMGSTNLRGFLCIVQSFSSGALSMLSKGDIALALGD